MNEKRKYTLYWICQIAGWLVLLLFAVFQTRLVGTEFNKQLWIIVSFIFVLGIGTSHALRFLILKLKWTLLSIGALIPRVLVSTAVFSFVFNVLFSFFNFLILKDEYSFQLSTEILRTLSWTFIFLMWQSIYFGFNFFQNLRSQEIINLQLQNSMVENELNVLKKQLNPHFIFNSMNTIRALVDEDPKKAKENVTKLSVILRNTLLIGKKKLIPFDEELNIVKNYLELEKSRFEERLNIEYSIDSSSSKFKIPPMMLQTIVENSIKHGISKKTEGGTILIETYIEEKSLYINIENPGEIPDKALEKSKGIGIENTKQRLHLIFGKQASFKIENKTKDIVSTKILIPQTT